MCEFVTNTHKRYTMQNKRMDPREEIAPTGVMSSSRVVKLAFYLPILELIRRTTANFKDKRLTALLKKL